MSRDWEEKFRDWAKPPGKTEKERCDNAASAIRNAIKASDKLRNRGITIFAQGSYRNNTNVRNDSDVDIGILCSDTQFNDYPPGMNRDSFDLLPASYLYDQYKNEVEEALVGYFGRSAVKRGNKAFDVRETSYHVEADVAVFFEHRRYHANGTSLVGVAIETDREGHIVINWPEQHYENGVNKNEKTGKRFKAIVRILKTLSTELIDAGITSGNIPGFLIECLVWNVPDDRFQDYAYRNDVRAALAFIFNNTRSHDDCHEWGEVSELKYLFRSGQKWTWQQAHAFADSAWKYIGFED